MRCQALHRSCEGIDDELYVLGWHPFNSLLNHMISVLVLYAFEHVVFELFDQLRLLVGQDMFERLDLSIGVQKGDETELTFWTTRHPYICKESVKM